MIRSPKRVSLSRAAMALAGLSLMIFAGACSRSNESSGQSNRGSTQEEIRDSANAQNGAVVDFQKDMADFRANVEKKVADNSKNINQKRADLGNVQSSMRTEYKKMLDDAEQRNNEIRDRVLNYQHTDDAAWDQFKTETNQALDDVAAGIGKIELK